MRAVVCFLLMTVAFPLLADVYRSMDGQGNFVFSDKPSPGAEKIEARSAPSIKLHGSGDAQPSDKNSTKSAEEEKPTRYTALKITAPENDQAVRDNAGNVSIDVAIKPALNTKQGHRLGVVLDGRLQPETWSGNHAQLTNVNRGTHTLQAVVMNKAGNILIRSESLTFHLLRFSRLFR